MSFHFIALEKDLRTEAKKYDATVVLRTDGICRYVYQIRYQDKRNLFICLDHDVLSVKVCMGPHHPVVCSRQTIYYPYNDSGIIALIKHIATTGKHESDKIIQSKKQYVGKHERRKE